MGRVRQQLVKTAIDASSSQEAGKSRTGKKSCYSFRFPVSEVRMYGKQALQAGPQTEDQSSSC